MKLLDQDAYPERLIDLCSATMFESQDRTFDFLIYTLLAWKVMTRPAIASNYQECTSKPKVLPCNAKR